MKRYLQEKSCASCHDGRSSGRHGDCGQRGSVTWQVEAWQSRGIDNWQKDGETRGAKVKVLTKKGKLMYLSRQVQRLCPLKVRPPVYAKPIETNQVEEQVPVRRVPRRDATINADLRRRYVDQLLAGVQQYIL